MSHIVATDIKIYPSTNSSGGDICLGGAINTTAELAKNQNPASPVYNLAFRNFTNTERYNGSIQHHCMYIKNTHASLALTNGKLWFSAVTPSPDTRARMGLDPAGKNASATTISNTTTPPTGVDFDTRHNDADEAIALPTPLNAGDYIAFWVMIELEPNSARYTKDFFQIRIDGNTP